MSCFCFPPYSASPDNSDCILVLTASTSGSSSTLTALKAASSNVFGYMGTVFYENITSLNFPIKTSGNTGVYSTENGTPLYNTTCWVDASGRVLNIDEGGPGAGEGSSFAVPSGLPSNYYGPAIFPSYSNNTTVWGRSSTIGRLNYCGLWPTTSNPYNPVDTWIGFTACIDIVESKTYYIGLGADDYFRVKLNGTLIIEVDPNTIVNGAAYTPHGLTFATWSMFPITLPSGPNYIELEGYNAGGTAAFGAEIYDANLYTLTSITDLEDLTGFTIFTTADLVGQPIPNAGSSGFTCPEGSVLNSCGSPEYCVRVVRVPCTSPTTTTTTTQAYLNPDYIPVNDCNVFTIAPMVVSCNVTDVTGKQDAANGAITLEISGGSAPYTIIWQYPSGVDIQGPPTIGGLSVGTYSATVRDYYGDFIVTTSCTVAPPTTTTTTSTTTLPTPYTEYDFCLTIFVRDIEGNILETYQYNFVPNVDINGYPSWISDPSGQEIVYYDSAIPNNGGWSLSGSPTSDITLNNITVFNSEPSYPPIAGINPNFVGWTILYGKIPNSIVTATEGSCF